MKQNTVTFQQVAAWLLSDETCSESDEYTKGGFTPLRNVWHLSMPEHNHEGLDGIRCFEDFEKLDIPEHHKAELYKKFNLKPAKPVVRPGQHWRNKNSNQTFVVLDSVWRNGSRNAAEFRAVCMEDGTTWTDSDSVEATGCFTLIKDV